MGRHRGEARCFAGGAGGGSPVTAGAVGETVPVEITDVLRIYNSDLHLLPFCCIFVYRERGCGLWELHPRFFSRERGKTVGTFVKNILTFVFSVGGFVFSFARFLCFVVVCILRKPYPVDFVS